MDWLMCLLPIMVCLAATVLSVKVSPKRKRLLAAVGGVLFLCTAFVSLVVYRYQQVIRPIRNSELLAGAEMSFSVPMKEAEMNDFQINGSSELYQAVADYLESALYLPCIDQDAFSTGNRDVLLQFGTDSEVNLWVAFYEDTGLCILNGTKVRIFPKGSRGKSAYQDIEDILESVSSHETLTVTRTDSERDSLYAERSDGGRYVFYKVSEKLRTQDGKKASLEGIAVGDSITVLSDGNVLLSDPYQIENIYKIYLED